MEITACGCGVSVLAFEDARLSTALCPSLSVV
jgi:hypothetical protein